jgi:ubiquinol-cytochrome c reductase cytochrome b subunit
VFLKSINSITPFKIKNILENHLINYPAPTSLYYAWGIGSLLGLLLAIQVVTGVLLAMHYTPHIDEAFSSVERIMREIQGGWFLRYMHANGSSLLFILLYLHIARGLYFASYRKPKQWVWCSGVILFILMAGIAFLGYTLPWGQMSFWGSTVITNLLTAIPVFGHKIVIWVWGGFAINNNTLNRFFSLHYFLSIIVLALSITHLILLHFIGSSTPTINEAELDLVKFSPAFVTKDAFPFIIFIFFYFILVIYKPNMFGHPDNYIRADALVTPAHIVPEWYFLPFYAMLKAFPSKAAGAIAMLASMLILLFIPWLDGIYSLGLFVADPRFRPIFHWIFLILVIDMFALGWLGSLAVSDINQVWMQICTAFYFSYFIVLIPLVSWFEVYSIR